MEEAISKTNNGCTTNIYYHYGDWQYGLVLLLAFSNGHHSK